MYAVLGGLLVMGLGALLVRPGLRLIRSVMRYEDQHHNLRGDVEDPSLGDHFWNKYKWSAGFAALFGGVALIIFGAWMVISSGH